MKKFEGLALLCALAATAGLVKIIEGGKMARKVTPREAVLIARGGRYAGFGSEHRIRHLRDLRPTAVWQPCWRTTEAAVFPPSPDYFERLT